MKKTIIFGTIACAVVAGIAIYYAKRDREYEEVDINNNNDSSVKIRETSDKEIHDDYESHKMNMAQTIADRHRETAQNMKVMNDFIEKESDGVEERKNALNDMLDDIENMNNED